MEDIPLYIRNEDPISNQRIFTNLSSIIYTHLTDFQPLMEKKNGKVVYIEDLVCYIGKTRRSDKLLKIYYAKGRRINNHLIIFYENPYGTSKIGDLCGYLWVSVSELSNYLKLEHIFKIFESKINEINKKANIQHSLQSDYFLCPEKPTEEDIGI